jgi:hypothetical protein
MKLNNCAKILVLISIGCIVIDLSAQVGINTTNPHTSAALDVESTNKGFLPPRMTTNERDDIENPAEGLTIFNTITKCIETWDGDQWYGPCSITQSQYLAGSVFCNGIITKIIPVLNPVTGRTWMDRNLGASKKAGSSTDDDSFGDLYQWGRISDGHQCRNSTTTSILSSTDRPGHAFFIVNDGPGSDWRDQQNDNLWQGENGVNNPCPSGYRIPTQTEWVAEQSSWISANAAGAFASTLKLPLSGYRDSYEGEIINSIGYYQTSTAIGNQSYGLALYGFGNYMNDTPRSIGVSVRCIKDDELPPGGIGSLVCIDAEINGVIESNVEAISVPVSVPYTGGNGGMHSGQTVTSIDVTGLNATLTGGFFNIGSGNLIFIISGTPSNEGIASFELNIGGQSCTLTISVSGPSYPSGYVHCNPSNQTEIVEVMNPTTGKTWMDRNLGANRVAEDPTDSQSYGSLFQWGRGPDGHQCINRYSGDGVTTSATTDILSSFDQPGHDDFIISTAGPFFNWRTSNDNNNLWQGVNGVNNPCPGGFRVPTYAELDAERISWANNNTSGAFASPLKLSLSGNRDNADGDIYSAGSVGRYWSYNVPLPGFLTFENGNSQMILGYKALGFSVRCIKN